MQEKPRVQPSRRGRLRATLLCLLISTGGLLNGFSPFRTTVQAQQSTVSLDIRISHAMDDVEERLADGAMYTDSTDLEVGDDPDTLGEQAVGVRFRNVSIPQGATIHNAYLEFETDELSQATTSVTLNAHNRDDAPAFTTAMRDLTSRPRTTANVAWNNIPAWNTLDAKHQTPNLATIVQEIVNRSGWVAGNSIVFIIDGTGRRTAEAYDGEPQSAPLLHVEYTTTGVTATVTAPATPTATPAPTTGTLADNFDNISGGSTGFAGNDGTLLWSGDWQNPGQIFVQSFSHWCKSGYCLRLYGNSTTAMSQRQANLSGASSAALTFAYARHEGSNGSAKVEISSDGVTYAQLDLLPTQYPATTKSYTIPAAYLTAGFRLRFVATNSNALTDLFVDDVVITRFGGTPAPTATHTPIPPPTATLTVTPLATSTLPPTVTHTPPVNPTATALPATATATTTATNTALPPTATPTVTPTVTPLATSTLPPTVTHTPSVNPTATALPPTATPTATPLATPAATQMMEVRIAQDSDDAEESGANGAISLTSSDLELVTDSSTQLIGLRFPKLPIPQGALIHHAYIEFEVDEAQSETTSLTFRAQASDDAAPFSNTNANISSRPLTSAAVDWIVPAWNTLNVKQQTPNLAAVLQAVINRAGWNEDNSLVIVINGAGHRTAKAYTATSPSSAPLLHVEYSAVPVPVTDLIAAGLEVTQGIQDLNHSVRLVKDKRTFVRFYAHTDQGKTPVSAQLAVQRGSQSTMLLPINGDNANMITLGSVSTRAKLAGSFLFELPAGFREGAITLTGHLNPQGTVSEQHSDNNSSSATVSFEPVPPIHLVLYSIGYGNNYYPAEFDLSMLESWLRRAYPISQLQVTRRTLYYGSSRPSCTSVNNLLASERARDLNNGAAIPVEARYYGMVVDTGGFMRGCGWQYTNAGPTGVGNYSWDEDGTYGDWYGGHELGHGYLREHANFCGATGGPAYPYPNGQISPALTGPTAIYGFDAGSQAIYGPDWTDIMTYCANEWISDFTYEGLMTTIQGLPVTAAEATPAYLQNQTNRLLIVGTITLTTAQASLNPIFILPQAGEVLARIPGDYAIILKDGKGAEVARYPFTPQEYHYGPPAPPLDGQLTTAAEPDDLLGIYELVPYVEGITAIEIWGPADTLLGRVVAQAGQPVITMTAPTTDQLVISDTLEIAWNATDPDGEALIFNVEYSVDQGQSWTSIALHRSEPHLTIALRDLHRGADLRFRVWASDGIHTGSDVIQVQVLEAMPDAQPRRLFLPLVAHP